MEQDDRDKILKALDVSRARGLFFRKLGQLEPPVLESLQTTFLKLSEQLPEPLKGDSPETFREWQLVENSEEPDYVAIREAVEAWASRWNLQEPWVIKTGLHTLGMWQTGNKQTNFYPPGVHLKPDTSLLSREAFPHTLVEHFKDFMGWEPTAEEAPEFRRRFLSLCEELVNSHIATQKKSLKKRDDPETKKKRELARHMQWLIRYQIDDQKTYTKLAKRVHREKQTVIDGIGKAAELVGLTLRKPNRGGRPKKPADF